MKELFASVVYWTFITLLIVSVRFVGIDFFYDPREDIPLAIVFLVSIPGGVLAGFLLGFIEIILQRIKSKDKTSFGALIFSRTLIYTALFIIIAFVASWLGSSSLELAIRYVVSPFLIVNFILFAIAAFLFHFFKQMNRKFGPGIMLNYLTGKYFNPKEEDRIFLFLDLKSSTAIAEKLSHVRYSKLIQDCFYELTKPLAENKGEIYQYVGDEAVISWEKEVGLHHANCLHFYYDFVDRLERKKEFFLKTYDVFPSFKAGLSSGLVTVAEVGELKTEIAFHGDVLNTASRIQGLCNTFGKSLLASETLVEAFGVQSQFEFRFVDKVALRGKDGTHNIYGCEKVV